MSTPFLGEIKMISFNFPPKGWAFANGQTLGVAQNQALFALYGTAYGGNGQTTFQIPNLQGCSALHFGTNAAVGGSYTIGQKQGEALHVLTTNEIPAHTHVANVSTLGGVRSPSNTSLPGVNGEALYDATATANATMAGGVVANAGGGQGHENRMPFLALNFIVALTGIFPSRN